jgi:hypothetical protein
MYGRRGDKLVVVLANARTYTSGIYRGHTVADAIAERAGVAKGLRNNCSQGLWVLAFAGTTPAGAIGWAKRLVRRSSKSEGGSVPTIFATE